MSRLAVSALKGKEAVTNTSMFCACAILTMKGNAPELVPPPSPATIISKRVPVSRASNSARDSSAARRPLLGTLAAKPPQLFDPIKSVSEKNWVSNDCRALRSTSIATLRIHAAILIWLTIEHPAPPKPTIKTSFIPHP
jgi:hypothetical protein